MHRLLHGLCLGFNDFVVSPIQQYVWLECALVALLLVFDFHFIPVAALVVRLGHLEQHEGPVSATARLCPKFVVVSAAHDRVVLVVALCLELIGLVRSVGLRVQGFDHLIEIVDLGPELALL